MELFKYIVKFIYRIRWWMVIFPCIAGIIAWFLTRNLEKTYDVKTTIFTGIISGYNVDATDTRNATVHMSNLMNIITTERTLKIVSLKLPMHLYIKLYFQLIFAMFLYWIKFGHINELFVF